MRKRFTCLSLIAIVTYVTACGGGASTAELTVSGGGTGGGTGGSGTGTATLQWTSPTQNSDGTALVDLAGFRVFQGTTQNTSALRLVDTLDNPSVSIYVVENLSSGTYYFAITAVSDENAQSGFSNLVTITIN